MCLFISASTITCYAWTRALGRSSAWSWTTTTCWSSRRPRPISRPLLSLRGQPLSPRGPPLSPRGRRRREGRCGRPKRTGKTMERGTGGRLRRNGADVAKRWMRCLAHVGVKVESHRTGASVVSMRERQRSTEGRLCENTGVTTYKRIVRVYSRRANTTYVLLAVIALKRCWMMDEWTDLASCINLSQPVTGLSDGDALSSRRLKGPPVCVVSHRVSRLIGK